MIKFLLSSLLLLMVGCVSTPTPNGPWVQRPPYMIKQGDMKDIKEAPIFVAVYSFNDMTGQRKSTDNYASFSSAVTQGGEAWVIESLIEAGNGNWFKVVERSNVANLINERNIIKTNRQTFSDKPADLGALLFAGMIVEGGIISYESNIVSGGIGASYLGIGASKQYRKDNVTVSMRFVSVNSGEVLLSSTVSKTILSVSAGATLFRYWDMDTEPGEGEVGFARNERVSMATRKAIDACIVDLMLQGNKKGLWEFIEPEPVIPPEPILKLSSEITK
tara:strand:- start:1238 stop:2065 length:828 start_codon:yes stop_codon:yes gene_type:complete